jgi:hypothetical protein
MNKYKAIRTTVDGITFDSKGEAKRYQELLLLQRANVISGLQRQVKYVFTHNGIKLGSYVADYVYQEGPKTVVEDFKSPASMTPLYRMKKKLMKAFYAVDIFESHK